MKTCDNIILKFFRLYKNKITYFTYNNIINAYFVFHSLYSLYIHMYYNLIICIKFKLTTTIF